MAVKLGKKGIALATTLTVAFLLLSTIPYSYSLPDPEDPLQEGDQFQIRVRGVAQGQYQGETKRFKAGMVLTVEIDRVSEGSASFQVLSGKVGIAGRVAEVSEGSGTVTQNGKIHIKLLVELPERDIHIELDGRIHIQDSIYIRLGGKAHSEGINIWLRLRGVVIPLEEAP
ncbi:MAG: hypothetical protein ACE5IB_07785 [Candidatus Geothermarchaeales archaeon]